MQEIIQLSHDAWLQLPRNVFQASWAVCGYTTREDLATWDQAVREDLDVKTSRRVLDDMFTKYGQHFMPQLCTEMEWQVKATAWKHVFSVHVSCISWCFGQVST